MRKGLKIGLAVLAVLVLCVILFAVYLGRYVVYTPDGVRLDFGRNTSRDVDLTTEAPAPAGPTETVVIEIADPDPRGQDTTLVSGWYIDLEMHRTRRRCWPPSGS